MSGNRPMFVSLPSCRPAWRGWCLAAISVAVALGPTTFGGEPASAEARTVSFRVFARQPISGLSYVPLPQRGPPAVAARPIHLEFFPTKRSPVYVHRGDGPIRFVDTATGDTVAEVDGASGGREVLLVFEPDPSDRTRRRYRVLSIDDPAGAPAASGLVVWNLSGMILSGTVDDRVVTLPPDSRRSFGADGPARVVLSTDFRGKAYQSFRETIDARAGRMAVLLLFPPIRPGSVEVQSRTLLD